LLGDRAVFNANNPAPQAGKYTFIIPGMPDAVESPAGDGFGPVVVDAAGVVRMRGRLADGTVLVQKSAVSGNGDWPLYASVYNGAGVLVGWMHFGDDGAADLSGRLRWIKPNRPRSKLYPDGFTLDSDAIGSRYVVPTGGDNVLPFTDGLVILDGGNLPDSTNPVLFGPNSKLVNNGPNSLRLVFVPRNGRFSGTFKEAGTTRVFPIKGVVLQRQNFGSGHVRGPNQSGRVIFLPAP
jgi:hypothetical protein